jgi:hypothetical protein
MNRTDRKNEFRTERARWMRSARRAATDGTTMSRAECLRKARFFHSRVMHLTLAEWA